MVDEIDVSELAIGQAAVVTLDALPDLELAGEVSSISAFADVRSGVVSYPIAISVEVPPGVRPLEGMSATATVDVHLATNVLLIPNQAISGTFSSPTVLVIVNDQQESRAVTLGATDGSWTEVVTGLSEGDMVAVQTSTGSAMDGFVQGAMQEMLRRGIAPGMGTRAFPGGR
jgi:multidrug efflux pump subunit AcrA (membrane-fusion protein)